MIPDTNESHSRPETPNEGLERHIVSAAWCLLWHATVEEKGGLFIWDTRPYDEEAAQRFFPLDLAPGQDYNDAWYRNKHPEDRKRMDENSFHALRTGQSRYTQEYRCTDRHGNLRWLHEDVYITQEQPGKWSLVGVCADVTEQRELQEALRKAKDEAERANRAKSDFLSRMSHELRTPMNSILGFAQLLQLDTSNFESTQKESVEQIVKSGYHLLELIDEVLDMARIESGRLRLSLENVPLDALVGDVLDTVRPLAAERSITIHDSIQNTPHAALFLRVDRTRAKQTLLNLLSNAIKYNRERGSVTLSGEIRLNGRLRLRIADTGRGIPENRRNELFQPFARMGAEATGIEGTGIGLTIAQGLAEAMGGELQLESSSPQGSCFTLELPLSDDHAAQSPSDRDVRGRASDAPPTLLYVEDNPANVRLVESILALRPTVKLHSAALGRLGIELAVAHHPDLIVLDIHLPEMDGYEALRLLKLRPETKDIPVVALSASAMSHDIERGLAAGFLEYLTKPVNVREFLDMVDRYLIRQRQFGG